MAGLKLENVFKIYDGNVCAVKDFNLEVGDKEFIILVGPSGCGKSTVLRMIAGLEDITKGKLFIDGHLMNKIHPKDRDIAMVFQNYALYPHMNVYDNMAFGLKLHKVPTMQIEKRVLEASQILDLDELLQRRPRALSGGQRQRVALGRSMVRKPKVFLLDEPLSNLDAKLRVQMRSEISRLHKSLNTTFIYVTHDQVEAMTMGTKIVVMRDGLVQQVDTPQNLYDHPQNRFVATFIGLPQMNLFSAELKETGEYYLNDFNEKEKKYRVFVLQKEFDLPMNVNIRIKQKVDFDGRPLILGVRPEGIRIADKSDKFFYETVVEVVENLGNEITVYLKNEGATEGVESDEESHIIFRAAKGCDVKVGDKVKITVDKEKIYLFDAETEQSVIRKNKYAD